MKILKIAFNYNDIPPLGAFNVAKRRKSPLILVKILKNKLFKMIYLCELALDEASETDKYNFSIRKGENPGQAIALNKYSKTL